MTVTGVPEIVEMTVTGHNEVEVEYTQVSRDLVTGGGVTLKSVSILIVHR